MQTLDKRSVKIDDMSFTEELATNGSFLMDGKEMSLESLKEFDLPMSWLAKQSNRAKRIKIIPQLIEAATNLDDFVWLTVDGAPQKVMPNKSDVLQYRQVIDEMQNAKVISAEDNVEFKINETNFELEAIRWFKVPQKVSRRIGDVLRLGARVRVAPMQTPDGSLLAERLICTNGMSKICNKHSFRGSGGSAENQLSFVRESVLSAFLESSQFVFQALTLQILKLPEGSDPIEFLRRLAKHYGFTDLQIEDIVSRYNADGDVQEAVTQWDLMNAITNSISHSPLYGQNGLRRPFDVAGTIVANISDNGFDLVDARVPQLIAELWKQ